MSSCNIYTYSLNTSPSLEYFGFGITSLRQPTYDHCATFRPCLPTGFSFPYKSMKLLWPT